MSIAEIRQAAGLTQEGLATVVNKSRQTVAKWEDGTTEPDAATAVFLADLQEHVERCPGEAKADQLSRLIAIVAKGTGLRKFMATIGRPSILQELARDLSEIAEKNPRLGEIAAQESAGSAAMQAYYESAEALDHQQRLLILALHHAPWKKLLKDGENKAADNPMSRYMRHQLQTATDALGFASKALELVTDLVLQASVQ